MREAGTPALRITSAMLLPALVPTLARLRSSRVSILAVGFRVMTT